MALLREYKEIAYQWGIWKTEESPEELLVLLPDPERYEQQLTRFSSPHRKLEFFCDFSFLRNSDIHRKIRRAKRRASFSVFVAGVLSKRGPLFYFWLRFSSSALRASSSALRAR